MEKIEFCATLLHQPWLWLCIKSYLIFSRVEPEPFITAIHEELAFYENEDSSSMSYHL